MSKAPPGPRVVGEHASSEMLMRVASKSDGVASVKKAEA